MSSSWPYEEAGAGSVRTGPRPAPVQALLDELLLERFWGKSTPPPRHTDSEQVIEERRKVLLEADDEWIRARAAERELARAIRKHATVETSHPRTTT